MSRFYGSLKGSAKTLATRRGTTSSGVTAYVRGWDVGVVTEAHSDRHDKDRIAVYATCGSNGSGFHALIGDVYRHDGHLFIAMNMRPIAGGSHILVYEPGLGWIPRNEALRGPKQ